MQVKCKGAWLVVLILVGLLASSPAAAGPLGEGYYFTSRIIDTPKTNFLGPRSWVICASAFYDQWGEPPEIAVGEGNIHKDVSLGLGLTEWFEVGAIMMSTDTYAGELKLRLFKETARRPSLSLGTLARFDKVDSVFYLVAGKHNMSVPLLGKTNLYGGVGGLLNSEVPSERGQIRNKLQGLFLGIEKVYLPKRWKRPVTFMLEHDQQEINLGFSYEFLKRVRADFALTNVEGLFGDGDTGIILGVEAFKI